MGAHMRTVGSRRLVIELQKVPRGRRADRRAGRRRRWAGRFAKVYRIEGDKVRVLPRERPAPAQAVRHRRRSGRGGHGTGPAGPAKDWWHQYSGAIPEWFQFYVGLEAAASAMQEYCAELVTGLLQTEAYARAVMAAAARSDVEEMDRQVAVRLERQRSGSPPPTRPSLWVVLDEAVLLRQVGGRP